MIRSRCNGNTLGEYAMIGGVVVLASCAALTLLGHSVRDLNGELNQGSRQEQMKSIVSLNFASTAGGGGSGGGGHGGKTGLGIVDNTSAGQNATSTDGNIVRIGSPTFNSTMTAYGQLQALAKANPDNALLHDMAEYAMWNAAAQSVDEVVNKGNQDPKMTQLYNTAVEFNLGKFPELDKSISRSVAQWNENLLYDSGRLSGTNLSQADQQKVRQLVGQIVQSTSAAYPDGKSYLSDNSIQFINSPGEQKMGGQNFIDMRNASQGILATGAADHNNALKTTLTGATTMEQMAH